MEQRTWFFAKENREIVAETQINRDVLEENHAINKLKKMVPNGSYLLGYVDDDGINVIYAGSRHLVWKPEN